MLNRDEGSGLIKHQMNFTEHVQKCFTTIGAGANAIKLFLPVNYGFSH
jgi:hypothetical protein